MLGYRRNFRVNGCDGGTCDAGKANAARITLEGTELQSSHLSSDVASGLRVGECYQKTVSKSE